MSTCQNMLRAAVVVCSSTDHEHRLMDQAKHVKSAEPECKFNTCLCCRIDLGGGCLRQRLSVAGGKGAIDGLVGSCMQAHISH